MTTKFPSFPFYPKDYLSSLTRRLLTPAGRGGYMDLISFCWDLGCKLPKDEAALQKLADLPDEDWAENREIILNQFVDHPEDPDGLTHPKQWNLWKDAVGHTEIQRERGKQGAKKRWQKKKPKDSGPRGPGMLPPSSGHTPSNAQAMGSPCSGHSQTMATPSSKHGPSNAQAMLSDSLPLPLPCTSTMSLVPTTSVQEPPEKDMGGVFKKDKSGKSGKDKPPAGGEPRKEVPQPPPAGGNSSPLNSLGQEILKDTGLLLDRYTRATAAGLVPDSVAGRLQWVAAAERALGADKPPAYFHWLVRDGHWDRIRIEDEERAMARLKAHDGLDRRSDYKLPDMGLPPEPDPWVERTRSLAELGRLAIKEAKKLKLGGGDS